MDVPDLEPGALARKAAWAQRGEAPPVRKPGEGVGLVHELRQLRGSEELLDGGHDGPDVDQRLRRDRLDVLSGHALLDDPLHPREPDPDLVLDELADRTETAVAEVIDVVGVETLRAGVQVHEVGDRLEHVLVGEDALVLGCSGPGLVLRLGREDPVPELLPSLLVGVVELTGRAMVRAQLLQELALRRTELLVDLVTADLGKVVPLRVEEEVLEQGLRALRRRRLAGTELPVDVLERLLLRLDVVLLQRELDRGSVVEELEDLVLGPPERFEHDGHVLAALPVDPDANGVLLVDIELE